MAKVTRNFNYPKKTKGSKLAAEIRKETNSLSGEQRDELFNEAMVVIYGGGQDFGKTARVRH